MQQMLADATAPSVSLSSRSPSAEPLELAIVVPTFNEIENVGRLVEAIQDALSGHSFEILVVDDDSPDGTADLVREIARCNIRIRCIQRIGRRGLSSAFLEGALATAAPVVAVMDGDMQHDEKILPVLLETLRSQNLEVVVGSRYIEQGGTGDWTQDRVLVSRIATILARRITGVKLSDPMSGFFLIRTDVLRQLVPRLSALGFKILLDIVVSARRPLRLAEIPYQFRARTLGRSKMDAKVLLEFAELLIDKLVGHIVPTKFVLFSLVGSLGVLVHFAMLALLFKALNVDFQTAQIVATLTAMTSNFALNNVFTYHDRRLFGWGWITGWFSFALSSSIGAVANVGIATYLFSAQLSNWLGSAVAGVLVGVVWNYAVTSFFTWKRA